jgi:hypothetical protein
LVIGKGTSNHRKLINTFTSPLSLVNFPYNKSGIQYSVTFKFADSADYSVETSIEYLIKSDPLRAIVHVINILVDSDWKQTASKIESTLAKNNVENVPVFMIGTKYFSYEKSDMDSSEMNTGFEEIFGKRVDDRTEPMTEESLTPLVSTELVLRFVDQSKVFESYLETDFGIYGAAQDIEEAKLVLEPVLRAVNRIDSELKKKKIKQRRRGSSFSLSSLLCLSTMPTDGQKNFPNKFNEIR